MSKISKIIIITFILFIFIMEIGYVRNNITKENKIETFYMNNPPELYYEIEEFNILTNPLYLAINDTKTIEYTLKVNKNYEEEIKFTSVNPDIASIDNNGEIRALNEGKTTIQVQVKDKIRSLDVTITNLINKRPNEPNSKKKILTCNLYSEKDNDLLDEILASRVKEAGLKTRAGAIAAARFITLEFPYRLSYFSENGRLTTYGYSNYVDGEGRYYHKGLYLHKSRTKDIKKSMYGPNPWGCYIYSYPSEGKRKNGLDCSGFIAWVLLNGGFNPGDIGAGISNVITDMTDLGPKKMLANNLSNIKVGDLLSGENKSGGHIAMLIGKKR